MGVVLDVQYRTREYWFSGLAVSVLIVSYFKVHVCVSSLKSMFCKIDNTGTFFVATVKLGSSASTIRLMVASSAPSIIRLGIAMASSLIPLVKSSIFSAFWDCIVTNTSSAVEKTREINKINLASRVVTFYYIVLNKNEKKNISIVIKIEWYLPNVHSIAWILYLFYHRRRNVL